MSTAPAQPRFGAFITMTVGILLFFGLVSRIHEIPGVGQQESRRGTERDQLRRELEESRDRAFVVFGTGTTSADEAGTTDGIERPAGAVEISNPVEPEPLDPEPERGTDQPTPVPDAPVRPAPRPAPRPQPRHHVIQPGETLWGIATKYYGRGHLHHRILSANPGLDPAGLRVGQSLLIPAPEAMAQDPLTQPVTSNHP